MSKSVQVSSRAGSLFGGGCRGLEVAPTELSDLSTSHGWEPSVPQLGILVAGGQPHFSSWSHLHDVASGNVRAQGFFKQAPQA